MYPALTVSDVDTSSLSIAAYHTYSTGLGMRFGIPVSEFDTVNLGFTGERTRLVVDPTAPQRYQDFITEFGEHLPDGSPECPDIAAFASSVPPSRGRWPCCS